MTPNRRIIEKIPSWIVTASIAIIVSYVTIQLKVNTLETKSEVLKEKVNELGESKANKELFKESTYRLDRIEAKLDRLIESKQQQKGL